MSRVNLLCEGASVNECNDFKQSFKSIWTQKLNVSEIYDIVMAINSFSDWDVDCGLCFWYGSEANLNDVPVLNHRSEQFFVLRVVLLLLQVSSMLRSNR